MACFITWFAVPPLMPTIVKPKCLDLASPTCTTCHVTFAHNEELMAKDKVDPLSCGTTFAACWCLDMACVRPSSFQTASTCIHSPFTDDLRPVTDCNSADLQACRLCAPYSIEPGRGCGGLGLSKDQVVTANAISVLGTILARIALGGIADAVGVRASYTFLVCSPCTCDLEDDATAHMILNMMPPRRHTV